MDGFLALPNDQLDSHTLTHWLETNDPKCSVDIGSLQPPEARNDAEAARRQTIFLLLGSAAPVSLYINKQSGRTVDTAALCAAARHLLKPRQLEHHWLPGSRTAGNALAWLEEKRIGLTGKAERFNYRGREFAGAFTPTKGSLAAIGAAGVIASLTAPAILAAATGTVGVAGGLLGTHIMTGISSWTFGTERRDLALQGMRENTRIRQRAASNGIWAVETQAQMRLHLRALRELDIKMQEIKDTGLEVLKMAIDKRRKMKASWWAYMPTWPTALVAAAKSDQILVAYEHLLSAFRESEQSGYMQPADKLALFRKIILGDPMIEPMLRVFHFFDHRGHNRGRQIIIKAFVVQEQAAEIAVSAYQSRRGAHQEAEAHIRRYEEGHQR